MKCWHIALAISLDIVKVVVVVVDVDDDDDDDDDDEDDEDDAGPIQLNLLALYLSIFCLTRYLFSDRRGVRFIVEKGVYRLKGLERVFYRVSSQGDATFCLNGSNFKSSSLSRILNAVSSIPSCWGEC